MIEKIDYEETKAYNEDIVHSFIVPVKCYKRVKAKSKNEAIDEAYYSMSKIFNTASFDIDEDHVEIDD